MITTRGLTRFLDHTLCLSKNSTSLDFVRLVNHCKPRFLPINYDQSAQVMLARLTDNCFPHIVNLQQFAFMAPADKVDADLLDASSASDPLLRRASYSPRLSHYPRAAAAAGGIHVSASTNDGIGIIFRIGGVLALVAAWLCWQMRQKKRRAAAAAASGETVYL